MNPHLFIHVQHLLGIGHMERVLAIASACRSCGFEVTMATGRGACASDLPFNWVPLPDLRSADASFSTLLDETGAPVTDKLWTRRREELLKGFADAAPSLLLVEGFPFARRRFRKELLPLLERARQMGIPALCSIRDILQPKIRPDRIAESLTWANTLFDLVLVHGDPVIARLEDSFFAAQQLETLVIHTGYVSKSGGPDDGETGLNEIVVSAGGGAVGVDLFRAALEAAALPGGDRWRWRLLVGRNMKPLAPATVPAHVTVEPARPDFRALLTRATASVSQAGYNTAVDIFDTGVPAVLVPFADGGQEEQTMRADRMAKTLDAIVLSEHGLTGQALLSAVTTQATTERRSVSVDLSGAERTARLLSLCHSGGPAAAIGEGLNPNGAVPS